MGLPIVTLFYVSERRRSLLRNSMRKLRREDRAKGDEQLIPSINPLAHTFSRGRVMRLTRCRGAVSPRGTCDDLTRLKSPPSRGRGNEPENPGKLFPSLSPFFTVSLVSVAGRGFTLPPPASPNLFARSCTVCLTTAGYCQRANIDRILYRMSSLGNQS